MTLATRALLLMLWRSPVELATGAVWMGTGQLAAAANMDPLLQYGAIGAMLLWFMFKVTPALEAIRRSTDRTTRALIMLALAMPNVSDTLQTHAKDLMAEVNADQPRGGSETIL